MYMYVYISKERFDNLHVRDAGIYKIFNNIGFSWGSTNCEWTWVEEREGGQATRDVCSVSMVSVYPPLPSLCRDWSSCTGSLSTPSCSSTRRRLTSTWPTLGRRGWMCWRRCHRVESTWLPAPSSPPPWRSEYPDVWLYDEGLGVLMC